MNYTVDDVRLLSMKMISVRLARPHKAKARAKAKAT